MFSVAPELLEVVKMIFLEVKTKKENWNNLVKMLRGSASSARIADTGGLKPCLQYVLPNPTNHALLPAINKHDPKSLRGLAHPILRYLILGWTDRLKLPPLVFPTLTSAPVVNATDESDESNEFLVQLVNGTVELKNDELPSFLWADGSYDPDNYDQGLLRSAFLLRVFRHIWTGPSSALCGLDEGIPPVCNARLANNKFTATPRMIGCAVVQARAMICSRDWARRDGKFNNQVLFEQVVELFAGLPTDPWAVDTIAWYNRMVFDDAEPSLDEDEATPVPSATTNILAQRAARQAAAVPLIAPNVHSLIRSPKYVNAKVVYSLSDPTQTNASAVNSCFVTASSRILPSHDRPE
ncbi:hypothetical protein K438DRAFT_2019998 [Mycena galopus ATCC 62051]|nr:hypothetical protein K438DRAFT_2019998 [Mycena galopus ATCC 62051]